MSSSMPVTTIFREDCGRYAASPRADWFEPRRRQAYERFRETGFPTRSNEGWKYLSLEETLSRPYEAARAQEAPSARDHFLPGCAARLVFVNGLFSAQHSSSQDLPSGARFKSLALAMNEDADLVRESLGAAAEKDALAAVNTYRFSDGAFLFVPAGTKVEKPLHLLFIQQGSQAVFPRVLAVLQDDASAKVIVEHVDGEGEPLVDAVTELRLGQRARLEWIEAGYFGPRASRFASSRVDLAAESDYRETSLGFGGGVARHETVLRFLGEAASATIKTLSLLAGSSQAYRHVLADHKAPRGTSRQTLKSVLGGKARSEANSLVHVDAQGVQTDSRQGLRALLLSDAAQAWVRPQLRIDTDDVACSHGAATGRIERSELFYLRSRGIAEEAARALLVYAFAEEVFDELSDGALRQRLDAAVHGLLDAPTGQGGS